MILSYFRISVTKPVRIGDVMDPYWTNGHEPRTKHFDNRRVLSKIQYEVEPGALGARVAERDNEFVIKNKISLVFRLAGEVELGCENGAIRCLDSDVKMTRASGIDSRHDGLETVIAGCVGKLVTAQLVAGVVIRPTPVSLPNVDECPRNRFTLGRANSAFKRNFNPLNAR